MRHQLAHVFIQRCIDGLLLFRAEHMHRFSARLYANARTGSFLARRTVFNFEAMNKEEGFWHALKRGCNVRFSFTNLQVKATSSCFAIRQLCFVLASFEDNGQWFNMQNVRVSER